MKRKLLCLLLAVVLCLSLLPAAALAEDDPGSGGTDAPEITSITADGNGKDRGNWLNGANYDPADASNHMTETSQGVYEITYTGIAASGDDDYSVKFVANDSWTHNWGAGFDAEDVGLYGAAVYNEDTISFSVAEDNSTVKLVLDLSNFDFTTRAGATYAITVTPPAPAVLSPVYVGGVLLRLGTKYVNDGSGSVKVSEDESCNAIVTGSDAEGYTLTLNGLIVAGTTNNESTKYKSSAIYTESGSLTIVVDKSSVVSGAQTSAHSAGVYAKGALTITGSGMLTATGGTASGGGSGSYGIKCDGALSVWAPLSAVGGNATESSVGVFASSITVGSEITATGRSASFRSCGMGSSDASIYLNGGKVTASGEKNAIITPFATNIAGHEVKYATDSKTFTNYNDVKDEKSLTVTLGTPAASYRTVRFYTNGGTLTGTGVTVVTPNMQYTMTYQKGKGMTLPKDTVTREGYTFAGWYSNMDLSGGAVGSIGVGSDMDLTFYAKWLPNVAYVETAGESPRTSYYASLADAISAAQDGDTVGLLADQDSAYISSGSFILDLNGHHLKSLTVSNFQTNVKLADAGWGEGQIDTITTTLAGQLIRDLCRDGYSLKIADSWATAEQLDGFRLTGSIHVYALPITKLTASADREELLYGYTDTATLTASAEMASAPYYSDAVPSYMWYSVTLVSGLPVIKAVAKGPSYTFPAGQPAGAYTFICYASYDGVSFRSNDVTVHVAPDTRTTVSFSGIEDHQTLVYDGAAKSPEGTLTVSDGMSLSSLEVQYEKVENGTAVPISGAPVDVGSYRVTYRVPDGNAYYQGSVTYSFTVTPRRVTVTAKDQTAYIGAAVPTLDENSYTVSGLIDGERLITEPTVKYVDKDGNEIVPDMSKSGKTVIRANGAEVGANYELAYVDGTLTVSKRPSSGGYTVRSYTIRASVSGSGTISPTGSVSVSEGGSRTFTFTPDKGYALCNVLVDGKEVGAVESYTFKNVRSGHTIEAMFMEEDGNPKNGVAVSGKPTAAEFEESTPEERLEKLEAARKANGDTVAWLYIPAAEIDMPVLQTENNAFYLRMGMDKSYAPWGSVYADCRAELEDRETLSANTAIFGASAENGDPDGECFSKLFRYLDAEFVEENPYIYLTLINGEELVFRIGACFVTDTEFDYIRPEFETDEEWNEYLETVGKKNLFEITGGQLEKGDTLLTLTTYSEEYDTEKTGEQRFAIVAKLLPEGETAAEYTVRNAVNPELP